MNLCVVSSFPPKQCGIAEFNQDLMTELLPLLPPSQLVSVAINEGDEFVNGYPADVKLQIRKNYPADYLKAADFINNLKSDVVLLQHQFALFGGFCGGYALDLIRKLDRPVICVVHTVPVRSDAHKPITKKKFFFQAAPKIRQFVVFTPEAKRKLLSYDIASEKITVIDHGAPDILSFKSTDVRHSLGLKPNEFMIFSFGLLQKGKGLDYAIGAMEEMAKQKLNCRLVILATPLRGDENEQYFLKLKSLIKTLHLGQYVLFQRVYLSKEQLYAYINACDIGILPYVYQSYISSGALSFFVAAAKPVITTRFAYASYLLSKESAAFVPFNNSRAISRAIYQLATDKQYYAGIKEKLLLLRQSILWKNKAREYLKVIQKVIT